MISYYPQFKVLNMAEDTNHTMHNLLHHARRGDARRAGGGRNISAKRSHRYGDRTEVVIAQHHWPVWGRERVAAISRSSATSTSSFTTRPCGCSITG
ncbi:MAG: hypothetical protein MZV49_00430 [Rhodopseudomonas palustris]|nr:hypothetical protein [Rhodopseudomonas palustris]